MGRRERIPQRHLRHPLDGVRSSGIVAESIQGVATELVMSLIGCPGGHITSVGPSQDGLVIQAVGRSDPG